MELTGYDRAEGFCRGGIVGVALIASPQIQRVFYCRGGSECHQIDPQPGKGFVRYHFREDSATLVEKLFREKGALLVEHTLTMELERVDSDSARAVEALSAVAGVVAVVTTACGDSFLLGHSQKFGFERPLRLVSCEAHSGNTPSDISCQRVVLSSIDSRKAATFTGDLPLRE